MKIKEVYEIILDLYEKGSLCNLCQANANKGLTGLILEKMSGLPNSTKKLDCDDGDLKTHRVITLKDGTLQVKETMALSMFNLSHVVENSFETSDYSKKLETLVVAPNTKDEKTGLISVHKPKLVRLKKDYPVFWEQIKLDYETIREYAKKGTKLTASQGILMQTRTKGSANSTTRAFYLLAPLVAAFYDDVASSNIKHKIRKEWWKNYNEQTEKGCAA
jgi:hypothetical protein